MVTGFWQVRMKSPEISINPMMRSDCQKVYCVYVSETKDNSVVFINTKTPHFALLGMELLGAEQWIERIRFEQRNAALGFSLDCQRQVSIATLKFLGEQQCNHRSERNVVVLRTRPWRMSSAARSRLSMKSRVNNPSESATRSSRLRSISTRNIPRDFLDMESGSVAVLIYSNYTQSKCKCQNGPYGI